MGSLQNTPPADAGDWTEGAKIGLRLVALLALLAWVLRGASLWPTGAIAWGDVRGFLADSVAACVVAGLAFGLRMLMERLAGRVGATALALVPCLAWAALVVAAREQVASLGSPLTLDYARYLVDPVFLVASAFRPRVLAQLGVSMLLVGLGAWRLLRGLRVGQMAGAVAGLATVTLALSLALWAMPVRQDLPAWRQMLVRWSAASVGLQDDAIRGYRPPDLSGSRWRDPIDGRPDIVLLIVEGVSGASLPSVRAAQGGTGSFQMPNLDRLARSSVTANAFVVEQRQTNRGVYTILCGQSPRLRSGEARLTEIARGLHHPPCLPDVLRDAGYRTVFFKNSPLAFMFMDAAAPHLGFDTSYDDSLVVDARSRNTWGADDASFLQTGLALMETLDQDPEPWFLTLVTSGTHHPFDSVPDDFVSSFTETSLGRAMDYLDQGLGEFLRGFEGRSRDSVLMVVSDESAGLVKGRDDGSASGLAEELAQNWGVLIVQLPDEAPRQIDEPVAQSDVALSLLDLLGLQDLLGLRPGNGPGGRSLFRDYDEHRVVFFGNTYQGRITAFDPESGQLVRCSESFDDCASFRSPSGTLFGANWSPAEDDPALKDLLRRESSGRDGDVTYLSESPPERRSFEMAVPGRRPIYPEGHQLLLGGQYLEVPARSRVVVDLAVRIAGSSGWAHVRHALSSAGATHYRSELPLLAVGDSFELRYSFRTAEPLEKLDARMLVDPLVDGEMEVVIERAILEIRPESGEATQSGEAAQSGEATESGEATQSGETTEVLVEVSEVSRSAPPPTLRYAIDSLGYQAFTWTPDGDSSLMPGPSFYAAAGSRVRVRAVVEADSGQGLVRLLLGSRAPSLVLAATEPQSVGLAPTGLAPTELVLERLVTETLNELTTGLQVQSASPDASIRLRTLDVEVDPP